MSKYIDVDKLKELIDEKWKGLADKNVKVGGGKYDVEISTYLSVLRLIDSIQQDQESVAERFARIIRGNLIGIDEEVQQKFEQLYFEVTGNKMHGGYND
jgi:hypothetical protein